MTDKSDVLALVCAEITAGNRSGAANLLTERYPFEPLTNVGRSYSPAQCMRIFKRDGFVDRYSGRRLIFPGTLRLLSELLPLEFPFHANWKTDACHFAFYEMFPTIDHVVPVSRGGADDETNWVSTSMVRNAAKANFTLAELGWQLAPAGDLGQWDGLTAWFLDITRPPHSHLSPYLRKWRDAATST